MKKEQSIDFNIKRAWHAISRMYSQYGQDFEISPSSGFVLLNIDAKKGTINVRLSKKELSLRKKKWKQRKMNFGNGTLWKYAQTVGPAYLGAPTHPGGKNEVKTYADI